MANSRLERIGTIYSRAIHVYNSLPQYLWEQDTPKMFLRELKQLLLRMASYSVPTHVTGLLRSEAIKPENKPIWYDIYQRFPPKYPPRFDRPTPNNDLRQIFYPEDVLRARIKKEKSSIVGTVNLNDNNRLSNTQKSFAYYEEFKQEGSSDDDAFEKAIDKVLSEIPVRRQEKSKVTNESPTSFSLAEEFKKSKNIVQDIFKE